MGRDHFCGDLGSRLIRSTRQRRPRDTRQLQSLLRACRGGSLCGGSLSAGRRHFQCDAGHGALFAESELAVPITLVQYDRQRSALDPWLSSNVLWARAAESEWPIGQHITGSTFSALGRAIWRMRVFAECGRRLAGMAGEEAAKIRRIVESQRVTNFLDAETTIQQGALCLEHGALIEHGGGRFSCDGGARLCATVAGSGPTRPHEPQPVRETETARRCAPRNLATIAALRRRRPGLRRLRALQAQNRDQDVQQARIGGCAMARRCPAEFLLQGDNARGRWIILGTFNDGGRGKHRS